MVSGATEIIGVIAPLLGLIGGFATFVLEHPKEKYYEDIPAIKENRLNDICNALGPIVSSSYDFARSDEEDEDVEAHEELEQNDRATVAVAESISPPDDIPPVRTAIEKFKKPEIIYGRCRRAYFLSYAMFFIAILCGGVPTVMNYTVNASGEQIVLLNICIWTSIIVAAIGICSIFYFIHMNQILDSMSESSQFSLDD